MATIKLARLNIISVAMDAAILYATTAHASGWGYDPLAILQNQPRLLISYAIYLVLRSWLPGHLSALLIGCVTLLLGAINTIKMTATGEPLVFYDLFQPGQTTHLTEYLNRELVVLAVILTALMLSTVVHFLRKRSKAVAIKPLVTGVTAVALALFPYYPNRFNIGERVTFFFAEHLKTNYLSWDLPANLRINGLPFHLLFTSVKRKVAAVPFEASIPFATPRSISVDVPSAPYQNIVIVLCESCWDNRIDPASPFQTLRDAGFSQIEVITPVYGGGTANAEFEVLTGLPSRNLSGIVYREYGRDFTNTTDTLPGSLKPLGYRTTASHNFFRNFWSRDKVYPKLGFEKYIALEDMMYEGERTYPEDQLVYEAAQHAITSVPTERQFLFLATVSTHGPYVEKGDGGYAEYQRKLREAIADLHFFAKWLDTSNQDYLLIVFGDHKPALNRYFYDHGILPRELFRKTGEKNQDFQFAYGSAAHQDLLGRTPFMIKASRKIHGYDAFLTKLSEKPLFCFRPLLARWLEIDITPTILMMERQCKDAGVSYLERIGRYPDALYFSALFNNGMQHETVFPARSQ